MTTPGQSGLLVIDKPAGITSHGVVGRVRRLLGTRKVGHAGTLDPMATGVLIVGIGRATRLLGHLALHDKDYEATIRLGSTTVTDDREGDVLTTADPAALGRVTDALIAAGISRLTGDIDQVPTAVSAIKVDGKRAHELVRAGEDVVLKSRPVHIERFDLLRTSRHDAGIDLDVVVTCSTGTYVRALARDLGVDLGVGAHLTMLRRTRIGGWDLSAAHSWDELDTAPEPCALLVDLGEVGRTSFPHRTVDADRAQMIVNGRPVDQTLGGTPEVATAILTPDGDLLALVGPGGTGTGYLAVFAP